MSQQSEPARADRYDVVIVGGGPAGLSAALMLGRARRSVLVIDSGQPRNAPAAHMHGFLTRDGTPPSEVLALGRQEVAGYGGEVLPGKARSASRESGGFTVEIDTGHPVQARRLLVTTGIVDELPDVPGLAPRWGHDVVHCPYCHGWEFRDEPIGVLGTGPMSVHQALLFRQWTNQLTLLPHISPHPTDEEAEQLSALDIAVVPGEVSRVQVADDRLSGVRLRNGELVPLRALAVAPRAVPRAVVLTTLGLASSPHPSGLGEHIAADATGLTSVPGVWVAGNVADPTANVLASAASGATAAGAINADLIAEDTRSAVNSRRGQQQGHRDARGWDERYSSRDQVFSGAPNGVLLAEVANLPAGRALDVGCGEGADARWLAGRGWRVTAVDISQVALERAAAADSEGRVTWTHGDLNVSPPTAEAFDLVSIQYFPLRRQPEDTALRGLLAAVAPGGTLLFASHDPADLPSDHDRAFDPGDYYWPDDILRLLGEDWIVLTNETRPRTAPAPEGTLHAHDLVLRAQRRR